MATDTGRNGGHSGSASAPTTTPTEARGKDVPASVPRQGAGVKRRRASDFEEGEIYEQESLLSAKEDPRGSKGAAALDVMELIHPETTRVHASQNLEGQSMGTPLKDSPATAAPTTPPQNLFPLSTIQPSPNSLYPSNNEFSTPNTLHPQPKGLIHPQHYDILLTFSYTPPTHSGPPETLIKTLLFSTTHPHRTPALEVSTKELLAREIETNVKRTFCRRESERVELGIEGVDVIGVERIVEQIFGFIRRGEGALIGDGVMGENGREGNVVRVEFWGQRVFLCRFLPGWKEG